MKVIIAGGRDFDDYKRLCAVCDFVLSKVEKVEIVSGVARGADELGERYTQSKGFPVQYFPAKWKVHGKKAGPIRNTAMAKYADALIAFWDGKSRGTKHMIDQATRQQLKIRVFRY